MGKCIDTGHRSMGREREGLRGGDGGGCLVDMGFPIAVMNTFWNYTEVMGAQPCPCAKCQLYIF